MQYVMAPIRKFLGWIIIWIDWLTRPTPMQRSPDEQEVIEDELEKMSLYHFDG
ncbi:MAG: hypothetical protein ABEK50_04195 [bacterium]